MDKKKNQSAVVFLPVKPRYAEQIMDGTKRVEFRKRIWKSNVDTVIIYASSPVKRILGYIKVSKVKEGTPDEIWKSYYPVGGISKEDFKTYFADHRGAVGIEIGSVHRLARPLRPADAGIHGPIPQSFKYVDGLGKLAGFELKSSEVINDKY